MDANTDYQAYSEDSTDGSVDKSSLREVRVVTDVEVNKPLLALINIVTKMTLKVALSILLPIALILLRVVWMLKIRNAALDECILSSGGDSHRPHKFQCVHLNGDSTTFDDDKCLDGLSTLKTILIVLAILTPILFSVLIYQLRKNSQFAMKLLVFRIKLKKIFRKTEWCLLAGIICLLIGQVLLVYFLDGRSCPISYDEKLKPLVQKYAGTNFSGNADLKLNFLISSDGTVLFLIVEFLFLFFSLFSLAYEFYSDPLKSCSSTMELLGQAWNPSTKPIFYALDSDEVALNKMNDCYKNNKEGKDESEVLKQVFNILLQEGQVYVRKEK